jgi:hypothetical protein
MTNGGGHMAPSKLKRQAKAVVKKTKKTEEGEEEHEENGEEEEVRES